MKRRSTKLEILQHVVSRTRQNGNGPSPVMTSDDFARDHVLIICEAIQLGLTRLYRNSEGYGYELRITKAGRLLAAGEIEHAAAILDAGTNRSRLAGEPPEGALGALLHPDGPGIPLQGIAARRYAPEMMRGVATGHLVVVNGVIHAIRLGDAGGAIAQAVGPRGSGRAGKHDPASALPSSRAARHVGAGKR